jgi:hypothetical protein
MLRRLGVEILVVQLLALVMVLSTAPPARADCEDYPGDANWAVGAGPGLSITTSHGVFGWSHVNDDISLGTYEIHVESLYIWHDADDMVEYGWDLDRGALYTNNHIFDARMFSGDYAVRLDVEGPTKVDHSFRIVYNDSTDRYDFKYDGDLQNYHRDPTWVGGRPWTVGEIKNQCNTGTSHWWTLQYQHLGAEWNPWSGTHWNCDTETHYGYLGISNTEFKVRSVTDTYTDGCDPFD